MFVYNAMFSIPKTCALKRTIQRQRKGDFVLPKTLAEVVVPDQFKKKPSEVNNFFLGIIA